MITVRLIGGMGNQMFQYAAGLGLALRLGTDVLIDASAFETYKLWPYQLSALCVPQTMATTRLRPGRLARFLRRLRGRRHEYFNFRFEFDPAFDDLSDDVALNGGFQSWRYFENANLEVRKRFALSKPLSPRSQAYAERISSSKVAVSLHVRRGDYLSPESVATHASLTLAYHERAVEVMRALVGKEARYFLFSDDPAWVKENIAGLTDFEVVEGQSGYPWEDMSLMSLCNHHIVANSSFSWWGAWLNPSETKVVIAPRQWFSPSALRRNNICDLLPAGWIAL